MQAKFWEERGYEFKCLSVEDCRQLEPGLAKAGATHGLVDNRGLVGGVLCGAGLDSSGDVLLYTNNITRLATSLGVKVRCGAEVKRVVTEPGHWGRVTGLVLSSGETVYGLEGHVDDDEKNVAENPMENLQEVHACAD